VPLARDPKERKGGNEDAEGDERNARGEGKNRRLAVLGLGQIGGSFALAGRTAGLFDEVIGFGRREESLLRARALGLCDGTTMSARQAVRGATTVLLATPLRSIPEIVDTISSALSPGALVIDVGSVKGTAIRDIEYRLPPTVAFVPCHPLAGSERFGPDAASGLLFKGRQCIICPTARTAPDAIERARALWEGIGAEVVTMSAESHDLAMAAVSHLPHVASFALVAALGKLPAEVERAARGLQTTSLRDTSRVAASSSAMWSDIFLENRTALLPMIDELAARLGEIRDAIAADDGARILEILDMARANRMKLLPG
jgi:prephenate dehydrogenase